MGREAAVSYRKIRVFRLTVATLEDVDREVERVRPEFPKGKIGGPIMDKDLDRWFRSRDSLGYVAVIVIERKE